MGCPRSATQAEGHWLLVVAQDRNTEETTDGLIFLEPIFFHLGETSLGHLWRLV